MKLSIITVNLNNKVGLQKTIDSVIAQTYKNFEFIVIDGGSIDGSKELIEENVNYISYWVSEPDKGVYNAMNKGVKLASGDYCIFMNSGDYFANKLVLSQVSFFLNDNFDVLTGTEIITKNGQIINYVIPPETINTRVLYIGSISHQSSFIKRSLLLNFPYDEDLNFVSDWKFWVETLLFAKKTYRSIDVTVSVFNHDGMTFALYPEESKIERETVLKQLFPEMESILSKPHHISDGIIWVKNRIKKKLLSNCYIRSLMETLIVGFRLHKFFGWSSFVVAEFKRRGSSKKNFKQAYQSKVMNYVKKKYISVFKKEHCIIQTNTDMFNSVIWVCWWQGEEMMPLLPKVCLSSIRKNAGNYEVKLVSSKNYKEFVDIPQYIIDALEHKKIGLTQFSDILRFSLLSKYGGLWIDSTVFVTQEVPDILKSDFYTIKLRDMGDCRFISRYRWASYVIGGKANDKIFTYMRDLFFEYMKCEEQIIDYFLIDYFLNLIYETDRTCQEKITAVQYNNECVFDFASHLNERYEPQKFIQLSANTIFHKLSHKTCNIVISDDGNLTLWGYLVDSISLGSDC